MPRLQVAVEPEASEEIRRDQILQAANDCFSQLGIQRTSVQDVARAAHVSRGTVYRYFEDRDDLISAAMEFGAQSYYRAAATAMKRKRSLAEQAGAMAEAVAQIHLDHRTRNRLMSDDAPLLRHLISHSDETIRRTTNFLKPYVEAAKERGEVAANLDVRDRQRVACSHHPIVGNGDDIPNFDVDSPKAVGRFVARFAVNGLR